MGAEGGQPVAKKMSWWKLAASVGLLLLLVGIFAWQVGKNKEAILAYDWRLNWELAALVLVLLLACSTIDILIWNRTLGWFTEMLPFKQAAPVYIWSFLARYIPGKVGSLIIRVALAAEVQRPPVPVLAASTVELALRTASALLLFFVAMLGAKVGNGDSKLLVALAVIPVVLICAHPRVMLPIVNGVLQAMKKPAVARPLQYREVLGVFGALVARWVLYGLAFALFTVAVFPAAQAHLLTLIGTAGGSWALGFIGMTPGGLGVAQGMQAYILTHIIGFPSKIAPTFSVIFLLWTLIGEGIWSLIAIGLRQSWRMALPKVEEPVAS